MWRASIRPHFYRSSAALPRQPFNVAECRVHLVSLVRHFFRSWFQTQLKRRFRMACLDEIRDCFVSSFAGGGFLSPSQFDERKCTIANQNSQPRRWLFRRLANREEGSSRLVWGTTTAHLTRALCHCHLSQALLLLQQISVTTAPRFSGYLAPQSLIFIEQANSKAKRGSLKPYSDSLGDFQSSLLVSRLSSTGVSGYGFVHRDACEWRPGPCDEQICPRRRNDHGRSPVTTKLGRKAAFRHRRQPPITRRQS